MLLAPVLGVLRAVPWWAWPMAALAAWGGWHRWQAIGAKAEYAQATQAAAVERAASAAESAQETNRRLRAVQEASDAAHLQAERDRAGRRAADAAASRLRDRIAALQADSRPADPAAAGRCQAAEQATSLLADVLRRADARAGDLAAAADAAITAGQACERAYLSLTEGR